jgi:membrane protease YdiL (CAAX protease family)
MGIVAAPVAEELVFRGVALPVLARRLGVVAAAVLVSLVFAAVHFHPEAVVPLFLVSLCCCAAYAATGRLLVPMVVHGLFNGVNLAVLLVITP